LKNDHTRKVSFFILILFFHNIDLFKGNVGLGVDVVEVVAAGVVAAGVVVQVYGDVMEGVKEREKELVMGGL